MKVLVTGGAGFIGSHIVDKLIEEGHEVAVIDNLSVGMKEHINNKAKFYKADIREREEVEKVFQEFKPDVVNHHAAHNDSMDSLDKPVKDAEINILGSINILELSKKYEVEKIIYASSGGLSYGEPQEIPTSEDHEMSPSYPYGISKHSFEHYLELYDDIYDLKFVTLRYGSVYGPRANGGVIKNFFEAIENNEKPVIFGNGEQTRDFIHVKDVVSANILALKNGEGYYNIGTCTETSINKLWRMMVEVTNYRKKPEYRERWLGDIDRCKLNITRAKEDLEWTPQITLTEGLEKMNNG